MKSFAKSFLAAVLLGAALLRAAPSAVRELDFPSERASLETLQRSIAAAGRFGERVLALSPGKAVASVTPFVAAGQTREAVFGKVSDSERHEIFKTDPFGIDWRAVDIVGNKALLFDGRGMAFVEADAETLAEVARRSVPWDMARPPRDRGGEATGWETKAFRERLARAVQATAGVKVVGLARFPEGWRGKGRGYFAVTRIKGFPLLEMECSEAEESPSACVVARACNVDGLADVRLDDIVGAAAIEYHGQRLILLGDASRKAIVSLKYESCLHVVRSKTEWLLPARLKEVTNFSVDEAGRLWVSTAAPDDYLNASLYFWDKDAW